MPQSMTGFAEVNGARIYYDIHGEGRPLVMVHAGIGDSRMWDRQIEAFAQKYRVIRYDARGYGQTELVPGVYSPHEDLYGLLHFLGVERAVLLGCSMGGQAIVDCALAHPEMAAALIPVCAAVSGFKWDGPAAAQRPALEAAYERGDLDTCAELMCQMWIDGVGRTPEQVEAAVRQKAREMMLISLGAPDDVGEEQAAEPPALGRLGMIHAPTLVITGDLDQPSILAACDRLAADIPGARRAVIAGTAHAPNMEKPGEFNRAVLDFLAGV